MTACSFFSRTCLTVLTACTLLACGDDDSDGKGRGDGSVLDGGGGDGGNLDARVPDAGDAGRDGRVAGDSGGGGSGGGGDGSVAQVEICDGLDNDGNGQIDEIDVGHDGVCDCLLVATLGKSGRVGKPDVFNAWLDARSDVGAVSLDKMTLTPALLAQYQVIVAQDLSLNGRAYSGDEVAALQAWVKAGGGLLTLIGYADSSERTNVNELLKPFDLSYGPEQILQRGGGPTVPITEWTRPHPVTEGVTTVGVDNGYPVNGSGSLLAQKSGYGVMRVKEVEKGHVIVWGDEWITFDSEWKEHPDYQVERLWLNMLKWLSPARTCQVPVIYL